MDNPAQIIEDKLWQTFPQGGAFTRNNLTDIDKFGRDAGYFIFHRINFLLITKIGIILFSENDISTCPEQKKGAKLIAPFFK